MTNVLIVDDHELIRNGIKSTLDGHENINVVGEARNGSEAIEILNRINPDIVLLDISIPKPNGIEVAQQIINLGLKIEIIFLTMYDSYEYINKCLELGVAGYLIKSDVGEELVEAIKAVVVGNKYYSNAVHKAVMDNYSTSLFKKEMDKTCKEIGLTKREKEVVRLVAEGLTSNAIASQLIVSPRTIDTHRANLMKKLEVKNSAELVSKIRELGILQEKARYI